MRALLLSALVVAALPCGARAETLDAIFARANAAYFRGDYDDAARAYRRLIAAGVADPDVTYNLAAAEARRGRYGAAIQFFERTLVLAPGDEDAERGLRSARAMLGQRRAASRGQAEVDTGPPIGEAIFGSLSPDTLAIATLALDLALFLALTALLFARRENVRLALGIAAVVAGAAFLVAGTGLALRSGWLEDGEPSVILADGVSLREGPDPRASERHSALEGQRAWVLDRDGGFVLVRIASLGEGWVEREQVGLIRP